MDSSSFLKIIFMFLLLLWNMSTIALIISLSNCFYAKCEIKFYFMTSMIIL